MPLEDDNRQSPEEALAEGEAATDAILAELLGGGGEGGDAPGADAPEPEGQGAAPELGGDAPADAPADEETAEGETAPEGDSEPAEGDTEEDPEPLAADGDAPEGSVGELRALAAGKKWAEFFGKLGLKPEDLKLDTAGWTNWRKANDAEKRKLREQEQEVTQKLTGWRDQLLGAQQQLQQQKAQLDQQEARIQKYVRAEDAFRKDGDPTHLVELVEAVAEVPFDEANRMILHKIRRTPGERALAKKLEEEAAARKKLEEQLAQGQQPQQPSEQEQAERDHQLVERHVDAAIEAGDLSADAKKVPHYRERVRRIVLKSAQASPIGRPTVSIPVAAARVLKAERARLSRHPLASRSSAPAPAPAARAKGKAPRQPLRSQSRGEGAPAVGAPSSNEEIIAGLLKQRQQRVGA